MITIVSLMIGCGGPLLLSGIARDLGKALEDRLNIKWRGKPTTILLRHKDTRINALTKKQYHRVIGEALTKNAPTTGYEENPTTAADAPRCRTRNTAELNGTYKGAVLHKTIYYLTQLDEATGNAFMTASCSTPDRKV